MNPNEISPYIRVAIFSILTDPYRINERILFDYELIMVMSGTGKIIINGEEYICKKDDVVLIPPNTPHIFESVKDYNFVQPHIHFDPIYTAKSEKRTVSYKRREEMTEAELELIQEDIFADYNIPYVFTPIDLQSFQNLFFGIIDLFRHKPHGYTLSYKAKMTELILLILEQFSNEISAEEDKQDRIATVVKNYIDNNFQKIITLDSLEQQFYINKFTLMRNFKKLYKINIMSYYKELRLEFAKNMLISTRLPITSIADCLGFNDVYSFSRFFKIHTALSPKDFRNGFYKE